MSCPLSFNCSSTSSKCLLTTITRLDESFLGALGGNSKPQASANPLGALTSLLGAGNQSQASGLTSMLGGLLGGQDEKQAASSLDGSQLLSLLANLK